MLNEQYGTVLSDSDPQLSEALNAAATALDRFIGEQTTEAAPGE